MFCLELNADMEGQPDQVSQYALQKLNNYLT